MPISTPLQVVAVRLDPDEKRALERMAKERNITLSEALRGGARLYMDDLRERRPFKLDARGRVIS